MGSGFHIAMMTQRASEQIQRAMNLSRLSWKHDPASLVAISSEQRVAMIRIREKHLQKEHILFLFNEVKALVERTISQRDIHLPSSIQNSSLLYLYTTFKQ